MAKADFSDFTPYASSAELYLALGWWPLPLQGKGRGRGGRERPVPVGFTGHEGKPVLRENVDEWTAERAGDNVALRLPKDVCGIDIDCHDGKKGAETRRELEKKYGKLPPAWTSTSREDGSHVRVYRKPANVKLPGVAGPGIEILQFHHRYMVAWPSRHPDTGNQYRWFNPEGKESAPPRLEDLTDLPPKWFDLKALPTPLEKDKDKDRDTGYTDPNIPILLIEGIPDDANQDEVLRDVCWKLKLDGRSDDEIKVIWQRIVDSSTLIRPDDPWTEDDFKRHLKGAGDKLTGHVPDPVDMSGWTGASKTPAPSAIVPSSAAPRDVALEYLRQKMGFIWKDDPPPLLSWCENFYKHNGSHWTAIKDEEILQNLDSWLSTKNYVKMTKDGPEIVPWNPADGKLRLVLASLRLLVRLPDAAVAGCRLTVDIDEDGPRPGWEPGLAHVPLLDAVLDINTYSIKKTTHRYFDHWCVPVTGGQVLACVRGQSKELSNPDSRSTSPPSSALPSSVQAVQASSLNYCERKNNSKIVDSTVDSEKSPDRFTPVSLDSLDCPESAGSGGCFDWSVVCPAWTKQLDLIFDGDMGPSVQLQEFFGYCLTTETSLQRALLVYGRPRSGKGTLARVLKTLVGEIASPTVDNYAKGGFQLKRMIGKSVAITWDAKFTARVPFNAVERIKSIIGEDDVQIDRKYIDPWEGKLICKLVFIANEQPTFPDASGAIGSKFVVLKTATSWVGEEDPDKEKALYDELPGILLWSLSGWKRLQSQGKFTETAESQALKEDLERNASPVKQFLEDDLLVGGTDFWQKSAEVYDCYTRWCWANGYPVLAANEFGKQLMALDNRILKKRGKPEEDGRRPWYYAGVKLAPHIQINSEPSAWKASLC